MPRILSPEVKAKLAENLKKARAARAAKLAAGGGKVRHARAVGRPRGTSRAAPIILGRSSPQQRATAQRWLEGQVEELETKLTALRRLLADLFY